MRKFALGTLCDGREACSPAGSTGITLARVERMNSIAVNDKGERLPNAPALVDGGRQHRGYLTSEEGEEDVERVERRRCFPQVQ